MRKRLIIEDDGTVRLTHRVLHTERAATMRSRPGRRSAHGECTMIGHAWVPDRAREGGLICLVCSAVRRP